MSSDLDPLVADYLTYLRDVKRAPENTIKARLRALRSVPAPSTATREDIEAWWASRAHLSPSTRRADLAHVRAFYKWARVWEHRPADDDPTLRLEGPKVPAGLPHPATRAEVRQLLDVLPDDLCRAVALGAYAGMRVAEAAACDWRDIDLDTRRIRIIGKGQKERMVGLPPALYDVIGPRVDGNVVTAGGPPYTAGVLQRKVNRAIKAAGVDGTFHWLRHRAATVALEATGGNLLAVARFLGHANVATTAVYAATSDEDLDVIAAAVSR